MGAVLKSSDDAMGREGGSVKRPSILEKANKWPTIIGLVLVGASIILEHPNVLGSQPKPKTEDEFVSIVFSWYNFIKFVSEVGFASIIAGIVSTFIELNAKREQNNNFNEFMENISKETVESVYKIKHSPEYVRSVIGTCFESPLIREDYVINYDISKFPTDKIPNSEIEIDRFVIVEAIVRYNARNIGAEAGKFMTGYGIPARSGELREFSKIVELKIGDDKYTQDRIDKLEKVHDHGDSHERMYEFFVSLSAGEATEVRIKLNIVKEMSDNDAFGFRRPTIGAKITLNDRTGNLLFGVTPRTSATLRTDRKPELGKSAEWSIDGPILPFDSVILWWRTPKDDGIAEKTVAAEG